MLKDLAALKVQAVDNVTQMGDLQIEVSQALKSAIARAYEEESRDTVKLLESNLYITAPNGLSAYVPYHWFGRLRACSDFIDALKEYKLVVDQMKVGLFADRSQAICTLEKLPCVDWRNVLGVAEVTAIDDFITANFTEVQDRDLFDLFLNGLSWLDQSAGSRNERGLEGRALDRSDWIGPAVKKTVKFIAEMSAKLDVCINVYINDAEVRDLVGEAAVSAGVVGNHGGLINAVSAGHRAENKIYYGAPGTGKSHEIDEIVENKPHVSTVFHPDTQYSDFVGCLKPSMNGSDIEYKFREGPFAKALKLAHDNQSEHCYLVIEEINRASAAAVFGEVFQLLDREPNGQSKYSIDINDPDMLAYLSANSPSVMRGGQLTLPGNLSIYATMNSSDQAVMPMDTAFKRRWKFKYKPIDFSSCAQGAVKIHTDVSELNVDWKDFALCLNEILVEQDIPEDRLLGPWFLKSEELADEESAKEALSGKLFMYLWDDVLRHGAKSAVFDESIKTYGQLVQRFEANQAVFCEVLLERFRTAVQSNETEGVQPLDIAETAASEMMSAVAEPPADYADDTETGE
jgi:hypothetical protein